MPVPWRLSTSVTLFVQAQVPNDNGQQSDIVDRYSAPMSASPPALTTALSTPQVFVVGQWLTFLAFAHTRKATGGLPHTIHAYSKTGRKPAKTVDARRQTNTDQISPGRLKSRARRTPSSSRSFVVGYLSQYIFVSKVVSGSR
jgi:hypothetical protein